jgi:hypothetical protein
MLVCLSLTGTRLYRRPGKNPPLLVQIYARFSSIFASTGVSMTEKSGLLIGLFGGWISTSLASVLMVYRMVEDVNLKLPEGQRFEYTDWYSGKVGKLKKQYYRAYPEGRLVLMFNISIALSSAFALAFMWQFGFFRR